MFMLADLNAVVDTSVKDELGILGKLFVVCLEDHEESLYNVVAMHVHR